MDLAENREKRKEIRGSAKLRRLLGILAFFCALFTVAFSLVYLAVILGNLSISSPISLPSQCKIVSSSVDLRSSKVCELGLLNYKAKHVLYPSESKKFRCHYDYYWASVFKVEYMDHSGQARLALAEAPNEALPSDCRPNFSGAWLTKDKFEVVYWTLYSHLSKESKRNTDLPVDKLPTMKFIPVNWFMRILKSWYVSGVSYWHWKWEAVAGVIAGFLTSMISIIFFGLLRRLFSCIYQLSVARRLTLSLNKVCLRRVCFLLAYVSFTSWLAIQYFRRIGLPEIAVYYST
ncbi:putative ubiquitin-fold modifier 1-like [Capsicum annuum]|nr:putative ubiquitin-fold modifier 1-like [Capsicum annuum]